MCCFALSASFAIQVRPHACALTHVCRLRSASALQSAQSEIKVPLEGFIAVKGAITALFLEDMPFVQIEEIGVRA